MRETRLKKLREIHKLKAVQIANASNIDRSTYSLLECGWNKLSLKNVNKLIKGYKKLGITINKKEILN